MSAYYTEQIEACASCRPCLYEASSWTKMNINIHQLAHTFYCSLPSWLFLYQKHHVSKDERNAWAYTCRP